MVEILLLLLAATPIQEEPGPEDSSPPERSPQDQRRSSHWEMLFYPFFDHGRRYEAYPYAGDGPYFTTRAFSQKTTAGHLSSSFGRVTHDHWAVSYDVAIAWSSGCDVRISALYFEDEVERGTERLEIHQFHLNIGGAAGPRHHNFSVGIGFGAIDGEEESDFGPSIRTGLLGFPFRPLSVRLDASFMLLDGEVVSDLRAELGVHLHRFALVAGVRSLLRPGGEDLTGPTLGISVFF